MVQAHHLGPGDALHHRLQGAPRTFYTWMKQKGKLGGQNKVPRVARSPEMGDELLAISRASAGKREHP